MIDLQIFEQQGWKFSYDIQGIIKFEKGDFWKDDNQGAILEIDTHTDKIKITSTDKGFNMDGPNFSIKFFGKCDSISIFNLICELTGINDIK